eukprot:scaffold28732_cov37-Prasinocladus_malaysianus.AAC.1
MNPTSSLASSLQRFPLSELAATTRSDRERGGAPNLPCALYAKAISPLVRAIAFTFELGFGKSVGRGTVQV